MNYKKVLHIFNPEEDNFTGVVKDSSGTIAYYENGKFHRIDGPAAIALGSYKQWFIHGELHREDGPATEYANGRKEWWNNGKRHRENGPAIERANSHKEWWVNGERHRENGPAVEYPNGEKRWYYHDELCGWDDDFTVNSWTKKWKFEIFK